MKIVHTLMPTRIVLIAGTYHGTLGYGPMHTSQKMPTTNAQLPTISPKRRFSDGGNRRQTLMSGG